jgi:bifunctional UDP-N-acetylglucosamine pyrophosphorylase/glucosamine-1-phosphate N-acetyltransferase/UDP-N-acetylglucosamine pyrophosphorylase
LLGTGYKDNPTGLGRIVRDGQRNFRGIVEEKDATAEQKQITEVNLSTYVFNASELLEALSLLRAENAQQEYYLTDCPALLLQAGKLVEALDVLQPCESLSINSQDELAVVEAEMAKMR